MNRVINFATRARSRGAWLLAIAVIFALAVEVLGVTYPLRWRWSNPRPHGGNVVDMTFWPTAGVAIQVAERGQIFASSDLSFWIPLESGTSNDLRAVALFGNRLLVTGESGRVLFADNLDNIHFGSLNSSTSDWLEAVTASPSLAIAVGDNGSVYSSANGSNWTKQTSGTTEWLRGVAWGASGGFVAVGEHGEIISSVNGVAWFPRTNVTSQHINRVVYSGNRYTAVAENGVCISSLNATNWTLDVTGATNDLFNYTSTNVTRLIVGDSEVRSQESAYPWTNELANPGGPAAWTYYANLARQTPNPYLLIAGRTGLMYEGTKTNSSPFTWDPIDNSIRTWLWDVFYPTNLYVAVGDHATVLTSGDGVNWRLEVVPDAVTNSIFLGIGGSPDMLVTVGNAGSLIISPNILTNTITFSGTNIFETNYSALGVLWYGMDSKTTNDLQGIAASTNLFVATGAAGTIVTSPDATNWNVRTPPTSRFLSSVTAWPRGWIATGDDGVIVSSANGTAWNVVSAPNALTTNWLYRVRYLGGRLIAVGQWGFIATSTNGTNWTKFSHTATGTTKWLNDITYVDSTYFVVGNSGTVLTSTNASNWTSIGTITRKNLYAAATDGDQFITVGVEGAVLRAQIIPDSTPMEMLAYDHVISTGPLGVIAQNLYLFAGHTDQRFTLDRRLGFETNSWIAGVDLEFFDGSGTLYYLETITTTNPPPKEFYRTKLVIP